MALTERPCQQVGPNLAYFCSRWKRPDASSSSAFSTLKRPAGYRPAAAAANEFIIRLQLFISWLQHRGAVLLYTEIKGEWKWSNKWKWRSWEMKGPCCSLHFDSSSRARLSHLVAEWLRWIFFFKAAKQSSRNHQAAKDGALCLCNYQIVIREYCPAAREQLLT